MCLGEQAKASRGLGRTVACTNAAQESAQLLALGARKATHPSQAGQEVFLTGPAAGCGLDGVAQQPQADGLVGAPLAQGHARRPGELEIRAARVGPVQASGHGLSVVTGVDIERASGDHDAATSFQDPVHHPFDIGG